MDWLQQQLQNTPPPDTIVHLGAGLCRELDVWRESGAQRIVLVEPNPELLPELRRSVREAEPVEIVPAAIAAKSGREPLRLFNFPMLSSLREPTGLYQILPGLTQVGRAMVETRTLEQLVDDLDLSEEGEHWLVIDTPGEEITIVDQLRQSPGPQRFARIFLSAGIEPMYQGAKTAQELLRLLQPHGIEPVGAPDTTDADWPRHHLRLDRMALECQRLKAELADREQRDKEHKKDLEAIQNALRTVEQVLAESERQHKAQLAEAEEAKAQAEEIHKVELAEAQQAHQQEQQKLEQQLAEAQKAHQSELEAAKTAAQKELTTVQQTSAEKVQELEQALEQALAQRNKALTESQEAKAQAEEQHKAQLAQAQQARQQESDNLNQQLAAAKQKITELQQSNQQLEEENQTLITLQSETERLCKELESAREDLRQQKSDLGIALRLQALRENDLRELQQRYGQMSQVNEQQRELLGKLHQRLSVAAEYLALTDESDPASDPIREELVRALTGKKIDTD